MLSYTVPHEIREVLRLYDLPPLVDCDPLEGAGGFSGARLWKLRTTLGDTLCLRRWPSGSNVARIEWIHEVLRHAASSGCRFLAVPRTARNGRSVVQRAGHCWELAPWLAGEANYLQRPTDLRLENAMKALASFHLATQSMKDRGSQQVPQAVVSRLDRIEHLQAGLADEIRSQSMRPHPLLREDLARTILDSYHNRRKRISETLLRMAVPVGLIPCLRDVRHDHVLFVADQVSGIVDYDAIRIDCVSTDLSRLLGSFLGGDRRKWLRAIEVYESHRPVTDIERALVFALDQANVALTGMQWLEWLCVRKISFENMAMVRQRLDAVVNRLRETDF